MERHLEITAEIARNLDESSTCVTVCDRREATSTTFAHLAAAEQRELAVQAWRLGLHAVQNAYRQAEEARLADVGRALKEDLEKQCDRLVMRQNEAVQRVLEAYFDPTEGALTERLEAFTRDDGELMTRLRSALGPEGSVLAATLGGLVGKESPLLRKLDPERKDGVVHQIGEALGQALSDQHEATKHMLDPLSPDGPIATLFRALRSELQRAEADREKQLQVATASLDSKNPESLLSQLVRHSQQTREEWLRAINPEEPSSPLASIKASLITMLSEHIKTERERAQAAEQRERAFQAEVQAAVARFETRKAHEASSPKGGADFEDAVTQFVRNTFAGSAMTVDAVGSAAGEIARCKVGDVVARFTEESAFAGAGLVVEAKHDQSYTETDAVKELAQAQKNRNAQASVFVMARTHARVDFPKFARHGTSVLVVWDPAASETDPYLHAALLLGQCMAARGTRSRDEGNVKALAGIEGRIEKELERLAKMEKCVSAISRNATDLADELRKGEQALRTLLRDAKTVLRSVRGDEDDFSSPERVHAPAGRAADLREAG